jgi:hypothetical protein
MAGGGDVWGKGDAGVDDVIAWSHENTTDSSPAKVLAQGLSEPASTRDKLHGIIDSHQYNQVL